MMMSGPMVSVMTPSSSREVETRAPSVTIVSLYFWPEMAGSAPPIQHVAELLADSGHGVRVLAARPFYPGRAVFPDYKTGEQDREDLKGIRIDRLPTPPPRSAGLVSRLRTEGVFAVQAWLRLLRDRSHAAVVIGVCPSILAVLALVLAVPSRTRRVAIVHDIQSGLAGSLNFAGGRVIRRVLSGVERFALNRADEIVTLSEAMERSLRSLGVHRPIRVVPPTIDEDVICPLPEADGPITLLYSGNIGRKQGLDQLLDLAEALRSRAVEAKIVIRGDGNYRSTLEKKVQGRGLGDMIRFEGFCPPDRLSAGLAAGHIHLVPQDPGGASFAVPSKIYAIMAAGRPFVCTADPGSPMDRIRVASGAFLISPPNQPHRLAEAVERLMSSADERARLGRLGRAYAMATAGKDACRRAYADVVAGVPDHRRVGQRADMAAAAASCEPDGGIDPEARRARASVEGRA